MGLTICYEIRSPRTDFVGACRIVNELHALVENRIAGTPGMRAHPVSTDSRELDRWAAGFVSVPIPNDPHTVEGVSVAPLEGALFPVTIGEGCEPLWLGLCRYPALVSYRGRQIPTKLAPGWRFSHGCKTQYASLHGWDNFHRCHTTVIALLRLFATLGGRVRIMDEGKWWPRRSDHSLRAALDTMNGLVAGLAGALRDASENRAAVVSPILHHPRFEEWEVRGEMAHAKKLREAVGLIARERRAATKED